MSSDFRLCYNNSFDAPTLPPPIPFPYMSMEFRWKLKTINSTYLLWLDLYKYVQEEHNFSKCAMIRTSLHGPPVLKVINLTTSNLKWCLEALEIELVIITNYCTVHTVAEEKWRFCSANLTCCQLTFHPPPPPPPSLHSYTPKCGTWTSVISCCQLLSPISFIGFWLASPSPFPPLGSGILPSPTHSLGIGIPYQVSLQYVASCLTEHSTTVAILFIIHVQ